MAVAEEVQTQVHPGVKINAACVTSERGRKLQQTYSLGVPNELLQSLAFFSDAAAVATA